MNDLSELNLVRKLNFKEIKHIINGFGFEVKRKREKHIKGYSLCFYYESHELTTSSLDFNFHSLFQIINVLNDIKLILIKQRTNKFK